jgi:tRNA threonylcarbamoyladenosine biosynthesis protein TsaB
MTILTLRTDKPEAEVGLYDDDKQLNYENWEAHRQLAETIHLKIKEILDLSSISWHDVEGIVIYKGPGSFTGLRIGFSVANALAYAQKTPIVAIGGEDWLQQGIKDLQAGKNDKVALPEYGAQPHTTTPRK